MSLQRVPAVFHAEPGFCSNCGTILPLTDNVNAIVCNVCKTHHGPQAYNMVETSYVIHFHKLEDYLEDSAKDESTPEGPVIDRKCKNCGSDQMTYSTLQLRSADEGQTIFYKCTKCKFRESENS